MKYKAFFLFCRNGLIPNSDFLCGFFSFLFPPIKTVGRQTTVDGLTMVDLRTKVDRRTAVDGRTVLDGLTIDGQTDG